MVFFHFRKIPLGVIVISLVGAISACGKKNAAKKIADYDQDQDQIMEVETNKEFSHTGNLVKDLDKYSLQKRFTFSLNESKKVRLRETAMLSKCEGDAEITSIYSMNKSDGSQKLSNSDLEGYTTVENFFPGDLPAGFYFLYINYLAAAPCSIEGASFILED
jgi:hypothetical protein